MPDGTPAPAHACGDFGYLCECAPVRSVEPPTPGVDGVGTVLPTGELIVVSYDPRYGDLVHSRFDPTLTTRLDTALDGFEGLPGVSGYRAGDSRSGLDHGRRPAIAERADGTLSVVYQVETGLGHMLIDPAGPVLLGHSVLPLPASTGRFQCAVTRRRPDGVEITAGYAFVADDGVPASTRVVTFESLTTNPTGAGEWAVQTAEDRPLPQRSPEPCAGACGLSEVCVSGGVCGSAIQLSGCPSVCGVHQVCASVGDGPAACRDRIYPETRLRDAVFGAGHHVACVSAPDGVRWLGAWQDRDAGSLRLQLGAGAPIVTVDGQTATDGPVASVGAHVAAAWTVAGIFVAYQDETAGTLKLAHAVDAQAAEAGIWTISTVHAATRPGQRFGLWTSLSAGSAGELTVVYGEGEGADIWLAHRDAAGCWGRTPVLTAGAYAFPSVTVDHIAQQAIVSALAYRFEPDLDARHAPVALRVGLPGCGTGMTP